MTKKQKSRKGSAPREKKRVKIFISHSHLNAPFMTLICEFLKTSELVEEEIRCTSVAGQGLKLGQIIQDTIRKEIKASKIVIGIFTKESLKSSNVMLELGAAWGFKKVVIPILGPQVSESALPEWLKQPHRMKWTSRACWKSFEKILRDELGMPIKNRRRFNQLIGKLVRWRP